MTKWDMVLLVAAMTVEYFFCLKGKLFSCASERLETQPVNLDPTANGGWCYYPRDFLETKKKKAEDYNVDFANEILEILFHPFHC